MAGHHALKLQSKLVLHLPEAPAAEPAAAPAAAGGGGGGGIGGGGGGGGGDAPPMRSATPPSSPVGMTRTRESPGDNRASAKSPRTIPR